MSGIGVSIGRVTLAGMVSHPLGRFVTYERNEVLAPQINTSTWIGAQTLSCAATGDWALRLVVWPLCVQISVAGGGE